MSLAWVCRLKCIVYFCFFMILCLGTSFRRLEIVHQQLKYSQSDVLRSISDNVVNIRQHKALNYIYPRRKKIPFFMPYMAFFVLCLTYMSPRSLLVWLNTLCCFFIFPFFRYTLSRKYQFLKELLLKYFLVCLIRFLCLRVILC